MTRFLVSVLLILTGYRIMRWMFRAWSAPRREPPSNDNRPRASFSGADIEDAHYEEIDTQPSKRERQDEEGH